MIHARLAGERGLRDRVERAKGEREQGKPMDNIAQTCRTARCQPVARDEKSQRGAMKREKNNNLKAGRCPKDLKRRANEND